MNCYKNGKNSLLFQFIRQKVTWTAIIIEQFNFCLLHVKFSETYFYQKRLHLQKKDRIWGGIRRTIVDRAYSATHSTEVTLSGTY